MVSFVGRGNQCPEKTTCDIVCQWLATGQWFSLDTDFLYQQNWPSRYNRNIVESDVKHHNKVMVATVKLSKWWVQLNHCWHVLFVWLKFVPLVVNTSQSFPHSWLISGFVTRLTRWVPPVEEELFILPEFVLLDL
jgi:hypothetical protein